jgi:hypothetical protein
LLSLSFLSLSYFTLDFVVQQDMSSLRPPSLPLAVVMSTHYAKYTEPMSEELIILSSIDPSLSALFSSLDPFPPFPTAYIITNRPLSSESQDRRMKEKINTIICYEVEF